MRRKMRRQLTRVTGTEGTAVWILSINTNVPVIQITITPPIVPVTIPTTSDHTLPMASEDFEMTLCRQLGPKAMVNQHHRLSTLNRHHLSRLSRPKRCVGSVGRLTLLVLRQR
jgi:hypothetical protein